MLGLGLGPAMTSGFNESARSVTFLGTIDYDGSTPYSPSFDIGAEDEFREIFILSRNQGSSRTMDSVSVAGVAMSKASLAFSGVIGTPSQHMSCWRGHVPRGAGSQTFTFTASGSYGDGAAYVFKVINRKQLGSAETDSSLNITPVGGIITLSQTTILQNGIYFAMVNAGGGLDPAVPTGSDMLTNNWYYQSPSNARDLVAWREFQAADITPVDDYRFSSGADVAAISWAFL